MHTLKGISSTNVLVQKICAGGDSNPGQLVGSQLFYH
jgi:hypothetical protein